MTPDALSALMDATWPPVSAVRHGPWRIREGGGGGSRVSAATAEAPVTPADIPAAEEAMRALGQPPLFCLRDGEDELDGWLAARGYALRDPVTLYLLGTAAGRPAPGVVYAHWPPLAIQHDIWQAGGIGPGRFAVMARAAGPKTSLLGRIDSRAAGTAFVAAGGGGAMLHALEIARPWRRRGLGAAMVRAAAHWAGRQGAERLAILVTRANSGGNSLYTHLGGKLSTGYHYRIHGPA